ncbi:AAA family ATPase [Candidatus Micrarchaeota archaeon]|nr:AAA family ATPase [Candidatus Micrarchaeota archaeon]
MRLIVTGTPGVGKTSLSKQIAARLAIPFISVNAFVQRKSMGRREGLERVVDPKTLERALRKELKGKKAFVLDGHLACEITIPCDAVLVMRCHPRRLNKRLKKRGYSKKKIEDNLYSEALDYCLVRAETHYERKKVVQLDASTRVSVEAALKQLKHRKPLIIRWLPEFLSDLS